MSEAKINYLKIVKDVSLTLNVPKNTVEHVLLYVFGRVREGMERKQQESFYLRNIGTLYVSDAAKRKFAERAARLAEKESREGTGDTGGPSIPSTSGDGETQPSSGSNGQSEDVQLSGMPSVSGECLQQRVEE